MSDLISRQAAIDIERNATVDTNPSHFEAHQKFTQFMDDAEVSSFGMWQWSNGFNTALTAVGIDLKKLPSAQPDNRLSKIADLVEGTIDHFDLDDAMDLLYQIKDVLDGSDELPSAQPEPCEDTISRQAAIDALGEEPEVWSGKDEYEQGLNNQWHYDVNALKALSSAQPEEDCDTCKHGYFGDDKCNNCRVRYPSHYERRTDENR